MDPLTVEQALAQARAEGLDARLLVCLRPAGRSYLLGVTSNDEFGRAVGAFARTALDPDSVGGALEAIQDLMPAAAIS